jgi:polyisoprenoid-binding protein YceI
MEITPTVFRFFARGLALLALAACPLTAFADAADYRYDPVHSQVVFSIDHDGYSRSFGRAPIANGTLHFDQDDWNRSSTTLDIDLSKLEMATPEWSKAVRASGLLATDRYPLAHFVSTRVERTGDNAGIVHGQLTVHGVTRPIDLPFRVNRVGRTIYGLHTVAGFSASATLDRTDFGITGNANSIGHDVSIWLEIEAIRGDAPTSKKEPDHGTAQ